MAGEDVFGPAQVFELPCPAIDRLSLERIKMTTKRVLVKDAHDEGSITTPESGFRLLDKIGKIIQEGGLHRILPVREGACIYVRRTTEHDAHEQYADEAGNGGLQPINSKPSKSSRSLKSLRLVCPCASVDVAGSTS